MTKVFSDYQMWALSLSIEKGDCPLKYAYMTENWSKTWTEIENNRAKEWSNYAEYELIRDNMEFYLQDIWSPNEVCFFDFWCWSWKTVMWMLKKLLKKNIKIHYHAFDISEKIINIAKNNIWELWENYSFDYTILDFEISNLTNILYEIRNKYNNIPVMALLLWNTVGNFDSMERVISNITESLRIKDRLVIWIERYNLSNEKRMQVMLDWYKTDLVNSAIFSTLEYLWVKKESWIFNSVFNSNNNCVEWYFELIEPIKIILKNSEVSFEKWDKIRLFKSDKMNESQFSNILLKLDLRVWNINTNLNNTYTQVLLWAMKY